MRAVAGVVFIAVTASIIGFAFVILVIAVFVFVVSTHSFSPPGNYLAARFRAVSQS
jgi:hypothetical protein